MPTRAPVHNARPRPERRKPDDRASARQRGYDRRWDKFSKAYRELHPLCAECERCGRTTASEHVDHIVKLGDAPHLKYDEANLQALCRPCHNAKTRRGE